MNKKIKIIDLLNKVARKEEVPKTIRAYYGHVHDDYKYDEILKWYITLDDTTVLNAIDKLNFEVEILEDNTEEIEELKYDVVDENGRGWYKLDTIADKVTELVKRINYIERKINEN